MAKTIYTIEANFTVLTATSYREARRIAASLRNGSHSRVHVIKGKDVEYDRAGFPTNITDCWAADACRKWIRVNP